MYLHAENEVCRLRLSAVGAQTDRQTDRRDQMHYQATLTGDKNRATDWTDHET